MASTLVPTVVYRVTDELIVAIDRVLGEPVDAYVNGSQVWFTEAEQTTVPLEWRLHPVAGYRRPTELDTYDVFPTIALALGTETTSVQPAAALWDGLEVFPTYEDEIEPMQLAAIVSELLGRSPDATGMVDHDAIADEWERTNGGVSIVARLLSQLNP